MKLTSFDPNLLYSVMDPFVSQIDASKGDIRIKWHFGVSLVLYCVYATPHHCQAKLHEMGTCGYRHLTWGM